VLLVLLVLLETNKRRRPGSEGTELNSLAVAWRYRMADPHAGGIVINKAGPIDRAQVEASLRERFGREIIELEPCL
jgi:hypothetical protein